MVQSGSVEVCRWCFAQPILYKVLFNSMEYRLIPMSEVALHRTQGDLWVALYGYVYDLSTFNTHPAGIETLVPLSGRDATHEFIEQLHSARELRKIAKFRIGKLVKSEEKKEEEMENE